jgi:hypothetical protein
MCEAYDAEYAAICSSENRYTIYGFVCALKGLPRKAPRAFKGETEAWRHGYDCTRVCSTNWKPMLPCAVESLIVTKSGNPDYVERKKIRDDFEKTGKIPDWLMRECEQKGWVIYPELVIDLPEKTPEPAKPLQRVFTLDG